MAQIKVVEGIHRATFGNGLVVTTDEDGTRFERPIDTNKVTESGLSSGERKTCSRALRFVRD